MKWKCDRCDTWLAADDGTLCKRITEGNVMEGAVSTLAAVIAVSIVDVLQEVDTRQT